MFGIEPRTARNTWTVVLVLAALATLYFVRKTLFIFVLALFLTYMMAPLVRRLERIRAPRWGRGASVGAAFALVILALVIVIAIVGPLVSAQFSALSDQLPDLARRIRTGDVPLPSALQPWRERIEALVTEALQGATRSAVPFAQRLARSAASIASNLVYVVLVPILAFVFLKDGPVIREALIRWLAPLFRRETLEGILDPLHDSLGQYVRALGLLALATFVAYALFFTITGVPYGIVLAAIAAVLEFIPVIGPLTAVAISVVVSAVAGYDHLLWIVIFFVVYRMIQDYVIAPRLMGGGLELHPALVIFGFLAGEELAGIPGMFLSVPVLAALVIVMRYASNRQREHKGTPRIT